MVSIEKIYQTLKTVFHWQSKHLGFRQKYSTARRIFNSPLVFGYPDETLSLVFDILLHRGYIATKSVTDTKCWVRRSEKRRLKQDAVPKIFQSSCRVRNTFWIKTVRLKISHDLEFTNTLARTKSPERHEVTLSGLASLNAEHLFENRGFRCQILGFFGD